jgi:Xaa-Pro aminopeptidase
VSYADRVARVRARMDERGVDVLFLSVGPDLPYFTGDAARTADDAGVAAGR